VKGTKRSIEGERRGQLQRGVEKREREGAVDKAKERR